MTYEATEKTGAVLGKSTLATLITVFLLLLGIAQVGAAQNQTQNQDSGIPASALTTKTVQAVGYEVNVGGTKVNMVPTELAPGAGGEAKVAIKSKAASANVEMSVKGLPTPSSLGAEFLTYVAWVVTPEGRTGNLGELLIDKNGNAKLSATTPAQTFSLIVTAEPYFAVRIPSEMVMLQSQPRKDTIGKIFPVSQYQLMRRAQYQKLGNPLALTPDPKVPIQVYEARNAVEIAKSHGAEKYSPEILEKATGSLQIMDNAISAKAGKDAVIADARQTAQFAEDARALSIQRQDQERIVQEREAAAAKAAAEAKAKADAEAAAAAAEAKRKADEAAAEAKAKADAELAAQAAATKAAEEQKAAAEAQRLAAEKAQQELRAKLLEQFNRVLPTTDSPKGLVVNMGDVLFDTGKADLRAPAQLALAKLTGIVLNYPSLHLAINGYTDSTGTPEFNLALSQKRADNVLAFLVSQGLNPGSLSSQGYGMSDPVANNDTSQGRQANRRVEIVVSGDVIGTQIGVGK